MDSDIRRSKVFVNLSQASSTVSESMKLQHSEDINSFKRINETPNIQKISIRLSESMKLQHSEDINSFK